MKLITLVSVLMVTLIFQGHAQSDITWADDVACIVYNNCTKCHHPGGIAPNSFMSYDDVYQKRASVRIYVHDRVMPPSPAMPGDVEFLNDNLLTEEERQTIIDWVLDGAPSGDLGSAPPPPHIPDGEEIDDPNAVFQMPTYTSQAVHHDDYRCFAFETSFPEDKWITGLEVVPGNKSIVHHVILYEDMNNTVLNLDDADPLPGYTCFGGVGSFSANFLGGWVPGQSAQFVPEGMGLLIPQGTNLIIQTHYPEFSDGLMDSTKINLQFAENGAGLRRIQVNPYINHFTSLTNGPLHIAANTTKTFYAEATVFGNVSVIGVLPHMHLIGRSMKCYAVLPLSNDTIRLFDIPEWDFEWQLSYSYRQPIHLPFGTKLYAEAVYDNTTNNPHNPSNPPVDVSAGEATTDEMFLIFFSYLIYQAGDEDIVFEDAPPFSSACAETVSTEPVVSRRLRISPNPADQIVRIDAPWNDYLVTIHDMFGRMLFRSHNITEMPTAAFAEGVYILSIENGSERLTEKIIIAH